ncbi:tRNA A64-2'-O-ribosylphosphate transferase [Achaetomium macrosporum]|uniref:tRNA A64-2'-O-ribosylphosphate transferase n=1 Tax=Achaetomium macrosporum TaxID=79813 RepID=A0AAN7CBA6_9PEZI|nr:tRNA A64-2'-O-ribosylphosphate transferase [Achaetomium macrosporum]
MAPPTLAEVIFPEQANHNFSRILGDLKRANLSITNRLRSIAQDAAFTDEVASALKLPLVANERCGSWYIDPERKRGSAYFKSTDGHTGQWKFSTRRLNLHLLELIGERDGCIIVDSTRRGKRMPDALSKTIPTWCAVLNRVLFPSRPHALYVPPNTVSPSEASQISALLPQFVSSFLSLAIDLAPLRQTLKKPLRPFWITQEDDLSLAAEGLAGIAEEYYPVVCCTASRRVVGAEMSEAGYIQGAGDDTENWALGLTAEVFWRHREALFAASESELPGLIREFVASDNDKGRAEGVGMVKRVASPGVFVGTLAAKERSLREGACVVALTPGTTAQSEWVKGPAHMEVGLGKSKAASRLLRDALPQICDFVLRNLKKPEKGENGTSGKKKVVVLCESGKDLSMGVALAVYCWCFDDAGNIRPDDDRPSFNKTAIRVRLGHIVTSLPEANPSRATLQSVNSFLMDWRR